MPSTDLVATDLQSIVAGFEEGQYLPAYQAVVDAVDADQRSATIVNRKARVERFKEAVAKRDRAALAKANKVFKGYLAKVRANAELSEKIDEPRQLSVIEAKSLMDEALDLKAAQDVLTARLEEIKVLTFGHMDEQFAAEGEEFPAQVNGSIDVPELGHRFAREGAGRKDPVLREDVLKVALGEKLWDQVVDRETVVTESVNIGKLMGLAHKNPAVLEEVRRALKVGEWKSPRLVIRGL